MTLPELAAFLESEGHGTQWADTGWRIEYGVLSPEPDTVISLMLYGGMADEHAMGYGITRLEYPRVQVTVRGAKDDHDTPYIKAMDIRDSLTTLVNTYLSGVKYLEVNAIQPPFFVRRDDNFRVEIGCNFQIIKEVRPIVLNAIYPATGIHAAAAQSFGCSLWFNTPLELQGSGSVTLTGLSSNPGLHNDIESLLDVDNSLLIAPESVWAYGKGQLVFIVNADLTGCAGVTFTFSVDSPTTNFSRVRGIPLGQPIPDLGTKTGVVTVLP